MDVEKFRHNKDFSIIHKDEQLEMEWEKFVEEKEDDRDFDAKSSDDDDVN